jgi:chromosome partitioning protein
MARIYTLANQKGGVGKTTTTINLAAYLGYFGQRVLVVDLDPQANATSSLISDRNTITKTSYEVLIGLAPIGPQILHSPERKISILPASPALAGAEVELLDMENRANRLKDALAQIEDKYDYILIDCPPSLNILTINGLVACKDGVIIPVQCEYLALEGLGQLVQTITRVKNSLFPQLKIRGVVLTMYMGRTKLADGVVNNVRQFFPNQVFNTVIPRSIRLAEAPSYFMPISLYAPDSVAAKAYESLAREVLEGDGIHIPDIQ